MSSEDYRTESPEETTKSSEYVPQQSESDENTEDITFPPNEIEKEIEEEHYDDFETKVEVLVQLGKKKLKPLELTDCYTSDRPGMYLEILPKIIFESVDSETGIEEVDFPKPIFRLTIDQGTIASVEHGSSSAQTLRSKLLNSWSQYEPRFLSEEDCDTTMKSESFGAFLKTAEKGVLESLVQNRTADSFFQELKSLHREDKDVEASKESALLFNCSFVCFEGNEKQIIKSISWHSVQKDIFIASTLCNIKYEERISNLLHARNDSYLFYVWNNKNQFTPEIFLEYFDDITIHKFNPSIPNIISGGSLSGQVILWNLEQIKFSTELTASEEMMQYFKEMNAVPPVLHPSVASNPDHSHTRGISDFVWIPSHFEVLPRGTVKLSTSNVSYQIATCGFDGTVKFWDLRIQSKPNLSISKMCRYLDGKWEPFHSVEMMLEEGKKHVSVTKFALRESSKTLKLEEPAEEDKPKKENISTEFYAGCDDGEIFCGNFKLSRDDTGKFAASPPVFLKSPHSGPITAIVISPFIGDIFLSTGSRTVAIWNHAIKATPIFSRSMHACITSAEWSNTRPALFILGYEDGSFEMWNFLQDMYEPFLIHIVSATSVTAISIQMITDKEHVLAVGDSQGIVYMLSLPPSLWLPLDNELTLMEDFVKKESERIQTFLTDTQKSSKILKGLKKEEAEIKTDIKIETITDEVLQKSYEDFLELEQLQLKFLGLIEEEPVEEEEELS